VSHPDAVTDQMVADIADTAREGGSSYWCDELVCLRPPSDSLAFFGEKVAAGGWYAAAEYDDDPRERHWHPLDAERMRLGIHKAAEHFKRTPVAFYEEHDAGDADVAFQLAIFGRIIYG
jgi:hypothetical protein